LIAACLNSATLQELSRNGVAIVITILVSTLLLAISLFNGLLLVIIVAHILSHCVFLLQEPLLVGHETVHWVLEAWDEATAGVVDGPDVVGHPLIVLDSVEVRGLDQWTLLAVHTLELLVGSGGLLLECILSSLQVEWEPLLALAADVDALDLVLPITGILEPQWTFLNRVRAQFISPDLQCLIKASNDVSRDM